MTIRELAALADVAPSTVYQIEGGRSVPRLSVVRRISDALNVDPLTVDEFRRAIRTAGGLR
jgi:transcriptional regulator with XRE-family HTH domain